MKVLLLSMEEPAEQARAEGISLRNVGFGTFNDYSSKMQD